MKMKRSIIDLTNQKFGNLTVIKFLEISKYGHTKWECKCDCGNITFASASNLKRNLVKTCGKPNCEFYKNLKRSSHIIHGWNNTEEYKLWIHIKERCFSKEHKDFLHYGDKGITLYPDWIDNANLFCEYISNLPETKYNFELRTKQKATIDRIDYNKGYEPGNLRWATIQEQMQNRSINVLNEIMVKFILWEIKINKTKIKEIYNKLVNQGYKGSIATIYDVVNKNAWNNINIDKEIAEYKQFGTVNGIKI